MHTHHPLNVLGNRNKNLFVHVYTCTGISYLNFNCHCFLYLARNRTKDSSTIESRESRVEYRVAKKTSYLYHIMCRDDAEDPRDCSNDRAWMLEPTTANNGTGSLTEDGVEFIARHKYKPGHYTHLDNFMNPFWTWITDLLPLTIAPNMVTTMGGFHCLLSYMVIWKYSPNMDAACPDWVVFLAGYCTLAYYTLDCMDGKQARRTQTSSPLGQLFDHGIDCLSNLAHISTFASYTMIGGTKWILLMQTNLQVSFFMAQWEEYYTHILPHAMGNWFGVTEVNYGNGVITMLNAFVDREVIYTKTLSEHLPKALVEVLPPVVASLELRHAITCGLLFGNVILITGSLHRVFTHENVRKNGGYLMALSKLFTPVLIAIIPFCLPTHIMESECRLISIGAGLLFSFLTKKIIVFSMAKMSFASFQLEALPYVLLLLWIRFDSRITPRGVHTLLAMLCVWNGFRLVNWARVAIHQICVRLDIFCFTIKRKRTDVKKD